MSKITVSILRLTLCLGAMVLSLVAIDGVEDWRLWVIGAAILFVATQSALAIFWDITEQNAYIRRIITNELGRFSRGVAQ